MSLMLNLVTRLLYFPQIRRENRFSVCFLFWIDKPSHRKIINVSLGKQEGQTQYIRHRHIISLYTRFTLWLFSILSWGAVRKIDGVYSTLHSFSFYFDKTLHLTDKQPFWPYKVRWFHYSTFTQQLPKHLQHQSREQEGRKATQMKWNLQQTVPVRTIRLLTQEKETLACLSITATIHHKHASMRGYAKWTSP